MMHSSSTASPHPDRLFGLEKIAPLWRKNFTPCRYFSALCALYDSKVQEEMRQGKTFFNTERIIELGPIVQCDIDAYSFIFFQKAKKEYNLQDATAFMAILQRGDSTLRCEVEATLSPHVIDGLKGSFFLQAHTDVRIKIAFDPENMNRLLKLTSVMYGLDPRNWENCYTALEKKAVSRLTSKKYSTEAILELQRQAALFSASTPSSSISEALFSGAMLKVAANTGDTAASTAPSFSGSGSMLVPGYPPHTTTHSSASVALFSSLGFLDAGLLHVSVPSKEFILRYAKTPKNLLDRARCKGSRMESINGFRHEPLFQMDVNSFLALLEDIGEFYAMQGAPGEPSVIQSPRGVEAIFDYFRRRGTKKELTVCFKPPLLAGFISTLPDFFGDGSKSWADYYLNEFYFYMAFGNRINGMESRYRAILLGAIYLAVLLLQGKVNLRFPADLSSEDQVQLVRRWCLPSLFSLVEALVPRTTPEGKRDAASRLQALFMTEGLLESIGFPRENAQRMGALLTAEPTSLAPSGLPALLPSLPAIMPPSHLQPAAIRIASFIQSVFHSEQLGKKPGTWYDKLSAPGESPIDIGVSNKTGEWAIAMGKYHFVLMPKIVAPTSPEGETTSAVELLIRDKSRSDYPEAILKPWEKNALIEQLLRTIDCIETEAIKNQSQLLTAVFYFICDQHKIAPHLLTYEDLKTYFDSYGINISAETEAPLNKILVHSSLDESNCKREMIIIPGPDYNYVYLLLPGTGSYIQPTISIYKIRSCQPPVPTLEGGVFDEDACVHDSTEKRQLFQTVLKAIRPEVLRDAEARLMAQRDADASRRSSSHRSAASYSASGLFLPPVRGEAEASRTAGATFPPGYASSPYSPYPGEWK